VSWWDSGWPSSSIRANNAAIASSFLDNAFMCSSHVYVYRTRRSSHHTVADRMLGVTRGRSGSRLSIPPENHGVSLDCPGNWTGYRLVLLRFYRKATLCFLLNHPTPPLNGELPTVAKSLSLTISAKLA
jgi:hypothetical protein